MFIPTKNREEIMQYLFKEGVITAQKAPGKKHPDLPVPNLEVIQLMRGFTSKQYVKQQYAWRHYYWYLTNDGINYLRETLHLPADIVPNTLKKTARSMQEGGPRGADGDEGRRFGGRGGGGWDSGETRADPEDGVQRSKREFVAKYGGFEQWDQAGPPREPRGGGGGGRGGWGNQESRVDPEDGVSRTKREFLDKYQGSYEQWDAAGPQRQRAAGTWDQETAVDTDGVTRTKREFKEKYGGFAEWDAARSQQPAGGGADAEEQAW